ncbi:MAG: CPBP family intramembrane metalloprotease [Oscillospiraceae bacterium]|nr:CPBP family intramembrane metalloprotease [Oscillospiraceae bacterium]
MKVIKNIWKIICYPLLYLGVQLVVTIVYMLATGIVLAIMYLAEGLSYGEYFQEDDFMESIFTDVNFYVPMILSILLAFFIMFLILRKEWRIDRIFNSDNFDFGLVFCVAFGVAMNILVICVLALLPISQQPSAIDDMFGQNLFMDVLVFAVLAPILEEFLFRGVVQRRLGKMINIHAAVFLQAVIFGVVHMNLLQSSYAFVLGVFMGYVYYFFDSIWYVIAIHVSFNATSTLLGYIYGDSEVDLTYFLIFSVAVFVISSAGIAAGARRVRANKSALTKRKGYNRWQY